MKVVHVNNGSAQRNDFVKAANLYGMNVTDLHDILAVLDDEGELGGFSVLKIYEDYFEILFFLIFEEKRRKGCGRFFLQKILRSAENRGVAVKSFLPEMPGLRELFSAEGFNLYPGGKEHTVSFGTLFYSRFYREKVAGIEPVNTKAFDECNEKEMEMVHDFLKAQGVAYKGRGNKKLSNVTIIEGKIEALYLCERLPGGIVVYYLHTNVKHPELLLDGLRVIHRIIEPLGEKGKEIMLSFATGRPREKDFLIKLTGDPVVVKEMIREVIAVRDVVYEDIL